MFDEAHRSYYDKNNVLMDYFDGLMIGLTATPRSNESKSTYDLFDCNDGAPTAEYSYNDAVKDGILVPYVAKIIETKILTEGISGRDLSDDLKDKIRKQEENPEELELEGAEFDQIFMDDKTNELIIHEFMRLCYKSDEGLPCKTIFFCASIDHAVHMKKSVR
ncbi:hypothetical protein [Methanosarcina horonobensis]|uniref:hypothetical protein n=1 Tax=Methanosarcina horonobensis TaxID=418008 RepID=UPI0022B8E2C9|nr:hypothetical protein [Methanosarcina horonobensis]